MKTHKSSLSINDLYSLYLINSVLVDLEEAIDIENQSLEEFKNNMEKKEYIEI